MGPRLRGEPLFFGASTVITPAAEPAGTLRLLTPSLAKLAQYAAALAAGWSPDTTRDVSAEQLAALRRDPHAFLAELTRQDGTIITASGRVVPRLPARGSIGSMTARSAASSICALSPGSDALPRLCLRPYRLCGRAVEAAARLCDRARWR